MHTNKRNVILYIAMSLDGYIADEHGSVEWLNGQDSNVELEDTFTPFFKNIDTIIMGRKTYDQIVAELSPEKWPYDGATTFVITHNTDYKDSEKAKFRNMSVCQLVADCKRQAGKDIWICGGAQTARQLIDDDLIDVYHLAIIPIILGRGIRLFDSSKKTMQLALSQTKNYNGIVELVYERR